MELIECSGDEYKSLFDNPCHVFNSVSFCELNNGKCDEVKYLLFIDKKKRLGLIGGIKNNQLASPFSAPFGSFTFTDEAIRINYIEDAVGLLSEYAESRKLNGIRIVLPPLIYHETFNAKLMNVLYRQRFKLISMDLDYYIVLNDFPNYSEHLWHNGKKNLHQGLESDLEFKHCDEAEQSAVYDIIKANRVSKEKPMTMTFAEIATTSAIIKTDCFLCSKGDLNIASAIAYHVTDDIIYIPYWGDMPGYSHLRAMNFMAYKIFGHYHKAGKKIVHIGIATEKSVPNYGLGEFKESIGCRVTPKFSYFKNL